MSAWAFRNEYGAHIYDDDAEFAAELVRQAKRLFGDGPRGAMSVYAANRIQDDFVIWAKGRDRGPADMLFRVAEDPSVLDGMLAEWAARTVEGLRGNAPEAALYDAFEFAEVERTGVRLYPDSQQTSNTSTTYLRVSATDADGRRER